MKMFSAPKPPALTPPATMPTPDDAATMEAKRKRAAAVATRTGRQSTILTDYGTADKLGG